MMVTGRLATRKPAKVDLMGLERRTHELVGFDSGGAPPRARAETTGNCRRTSVLAFRKIFRRTEVGRIGLVTADESLDACGHAFRDPRLCSPRHPDA